MIATVKFTSKTTGVAPDTTICEVTGGALSGIGNGVLLAIELVLAMQPGAGGRGARGTGAPRA